VTRRSTLVHEFVDFIPDQLEQGVIYVALEYGAVVHLCCDGCGERVSTPLHPAQWKLIFDGETISLRPSVGSSSLACKSHYSIEQGRVQWYRPLSSQEAATDRDKDLAAVDKHFAADRQFQAAGPPKTLHEAPARRPWWRRLVGR